MADEPLAQQLATLRTLLAEVDARLARAPVAPTGLEDLKRSVDTLRTNIWSIMSAGYGARSHVLIERFRLRRAIEGLRTLSAELESGKSTTLHPEHTELQMLARKIADQIGRLH